MTETERLRALLDERGVEWEAWDGVHPITVWHDEQFVYEYMERTLLGGTKPFTGEVVDGTGRLEAVIHVCSPEQAVEATLGRGTCHIVKETRMLHSMLHGDTEVTDEKCSACGEYMEVGFGVHRNYCPNCGRRVEVDA